MMTMTTTPSVRALTALALLLCLTAPTSADVRIHGATTVAFGLMRPHQLAIEQGSGATLIVLPSSTSHGLLDLVAGRADIAMLAEPFESIAASVNRKQPGTVDTALFVGAHVGTAQVQFIVHPTNPVGTISKDRLAGLFSGTIKNWSQIGGPNLAILLVGEPTSSPHRMIQEALGISYAADMRIVQNTNQTAMIVAQAPGAISYISSAHKLPIRDKIRIVDTSLQLRLELHLAYRKDAPDEVRRVVEAAMQVGAP